MEEDRRWLDMDLAVRGKEWDLYQSEMEAEYIDNRANKSMDRCRLEGILEGRGHLQDQTSTTRTMAMQHTLGMGRCPGMQRTGGKRERLLPGVREPTRQASLPRG